MNSLQSHDGRKGEKIFPPDLILLPHDRRIYIVVLLLSVLSAAENGSWVAVNGPYEDYISNVLISENGCPFVSTDSGGFASYDGCKTWTFYLLAVLTNS